MTIANWWARPLRQLLQFELHHAPCRKNHTQPWTPTTGAGGHCCVFTPPVSSPCSCCPRRRSLENRTGSTGGWHRSSPAEERGGLTFNWSLLGRFRLLFPERFPSDLGFKSPELNNYNQPQTAFFFIIISQSE